MPTMRRKPANKRYSYYSEILVMMDQLLDAADDDISRAALDPVAALRVKCQTLTTALRVSLLALSCHGQSKDFSKQIAQNLEAITGLKKKWEGEGQEDKGQRTIQELIQEREQESL